MGKPIEREFGAVKTILKHAKYSGQACVVPASLGTVVDGRKIAKMGTPFPSDDASCKGYLLTDVDVTMGDAPGTYVYAGDVDLAKVEVEISAEAKGATPRVTFFE